MGICYTLMMMDEWNWGDEKKDEHLKKFEAAFAEMGYPIERLAEWDSWVVYDIDKQFPLRDERKKLILSSCDACYYCGDTSQYDLQKL